MTPKPEYGPARERLSLHDAMRVLDREALVLFIVQMWNRWRLRLASRIMGGGWHGMVMALWLIRERALDAITPEGRVILARCEPLAEALYTQLPGEWRLTIEYVGPIPSEKAAVGSALDSLTTETEKSNG